MLEKWVEGEVDKINENFQSKLFPVKFYDSSINPFLGNDGNTYGFFSVDSLILGEIDIVLGYGHVWSEFVEEIAANHYSIRTDIPSETNNMAMIYAGSDFKEDNELNRKKINHCLGSIGTFSCWYIAALQSYEIEHPRSEEEITRFLSNQCNSAIKKYTHVPRSLLH